MASIIKVPALRIQQSKKKVIYQFTIDGKLLPRFAVISRIRRDEDRKIVGYQRPESLAHIASIRRYIESESPMIPNSIVIAFTKSVRFRRTFSGRSFKLLSMFSPEFHFPLFYLSIICCK